MMSALVILAMAVMYHGWAAFASINLLELLPIPRGVRKLQWTLGPSSDLAQRGRIGHERHRVRRDVRSGCAGLHGTGMR